MNAITEVISNLEGKKTEIVEQLAALRIRKGDAALQAAVGDVSALESIASIDREIRDAQATIDATDAALSAAARKQEAAQVDAKAGKVKSALAAMPAAVKRGVIATDRVSAAITELGKAWAELEAAADSANELAWECQNPFLSDQIERQNKADLFVLATLAGKLLWCATGDKIQASSNRLDTAELSVKEVLPLMRNLFEIMPGEAKRHAARSIALITG